LRSEAFRGSKKCMIGDRPNKQTEFEASDASRVSRRRLSESPKPAFELFPDKFEHYFDVQKGSQFINAGA
jgi:hypothetical protein